LDSIPERRFHFGGSLQGAQHVNGSDRLASQFGSDICGNNREAEYLDVKCLLRFSSHLEVFATVTTQSKA
jgi:hypothetical protein